MASTLVSGSSGPGSSPGWGYSIAFLDKAISRDPDCVYLHLLGLENGTKNSMLG